MDTTTPACPRSGAANALLFTLAVLMVLLAPLLGLIAGLIGAWHALLAGWLWYLTPETIRLLAG